MRVFDGMSGGCGSFARDDVVLGLLMSRLRSAIDPSHNSDHTCTHSVIGCQRMRRDGLGIIEDRNTLGLHATNGGRGVSRSGERCISERKRDKEGNNIEILQWLSESY